MEDEYHFLNICPDYQEKKMFVTIDYLNKKLIAKHVFKCFEKIKEEDGKK